MSTYGEVHTLGQVHTRGQVHTFRNEQYSL